MIRRSAARMEASTMIAGRGARTRAALMDMRSRGQRHAMTRVHVTTPAACPQVYAHFRYTEQKI